MKAFFITEEEFENLVRNIRNAGQRFDYGADFRLSEKEFAAELAKGIECRPINIDDVTVGLIESPCKFYPKDNIIGFSQKDGQLRGVFIKD
jgi:hypothetical protein